MIRKSFTGLPTPAYGRPSLAKARLLFASAHKAAA